MSTVHQGKSLFSGAVPQQQRVVGTGLLLFLKSGSEAFLECSQAEAKELRAWLRSSELGSLAPPPAFLEERGIYVGAGDVRMAGDPKALVSLSTLPLVTQEAPGPTADEDAEEEAGVEGWTDEQIRDAIEALQSKATKTLEDSTQMISLAAILAKRQEKKA